jgi:hypothetical protein
LWYLRLDLGGDVYDARRPWLLLPQYGGFRCEFKPNYEDNRSAFAKLETASGRNESRRAYPLAVDVGSITRVKIGERPPAIVPTQFSVFARDHRVRSALVYEVRFGVAAYADNALIKCPFRRQSTT